MKVNRLPNYTHLIWKAVKLAKKLEWATPSIATAIARLLRYLRALILSINSQFKGCRNKYAIRLV